MQDVYSTSDDLYQSLWKWLEEFTDSSDTLLSILSICSSDAKTTNVVNNVADFAEFWYPLFMEFLLALPTTDLASERRRFIEQCRIHFARNSRALQLVDDFEANYVPEKALFYYSSDSFVYRLINRALRQQAIAGIINFRFFLLDIRSQLQNEFEIFFAATGEEDFWKTFFRGQQMTHDELNELQKKHRAGTLITTNSYFSTSMNRDIARKFAGTATKEDVAVIFEVTAHITNSGKKQRKPFAFIGNHSKFGMEESEVLFSIGSFFKINKIFFDEADVVWIVQITFIDDDDASLEVTKDYCTLRTCSLEAMMIKVGNLLADHPRQSISAATAFYKMIMELNCPETLTAARFTGLGWLALKEKNLTSAISLQHKALENYERLAECEDANLTDLRVMCYNCIGTAYRLQKEYKQALSYFLKAQELVFKIPIDKYAMYNGYRNITLINIASIYKLMNEVSRAWKTFKKMLDYETNSCIRFRGHIFLTIAQAGLHEAQSDHDVDEYERCSQSWKAFLDVSLTSLSSNYRRSIISGVLLLGFEYANNQQTRTMAIDYFKKIIDISQRFVNANRNDRRIVLQCQNEVSRLYTKKRDYDHALHHALEALQMCNDDDLTDIAECYESMVQIYEQRLSDEKNDLTDIAERYESTTQIYEQRVLDEKDDFTDIAECCESMAQIDEQRLLDEKDDFTDIAECCESMAQIDEQRLSDEKDDFTDITECCESMPQIYEQCLSDEKDDLTPEDISRVIIAENSFASTYNNLETNPSATIRFDRSEFAFGQFSINKINPAVTQDNDRKRQLGYCLMKMAALAQMQGYKEEEQAKIDDDDLLRRQARDHVARARQLLHKASELLKDNPSVQRICANNFAYIDGNFEPISRYYLHDLHTNQQKNALCIGEDTFCYLAHLRRRQSNVKREQQWYEHAVRYFHKHGHICEHTVWCFYWLAHFHEKHGTLHAAIDVYQSLVSYLLKYNPPSFLRTSIEPIVMKLVQYFKEKEENKRVIIILQQLVQLILTEPVDDICMIDEQFKNIMKICNDTTFLVAQAYAAYLEMMLRYKYYPSNSYIYVVESTFRQALSVCQARNHFKNAVKVCEEFIELIVGVKTDRSTTAAALKRLALDFEPLSLFEVALDMYRYLGEFIVKYHNEDDLILAGFVITRCKYLKRKGAVVNDATQQMLVRLMNFYHNTALPQFIVDDYLKTMKPNEDRHSATGIYLSLLEFCLKYRSEDYDRHVDTNVTALRDRPEELIAFIATKRVDYKMLIQSIIEQCGNIPKITPSLEKSSQDFKMNAEEWFQSEEDPDDAYWKQLLRCLLEWQSKDDECMASCYTKLHNMSLAVSVFDTKLYGDPTLRFSANACRRYLQYAYPQASSEQRTELEHRYYDHFLILCDSCTERVSYEILPVE